MTDLFRLGTASCESGPRTLLNSTAGTYYLCDLIGKEVGVREIIADWSVLRPVLMEAVGRAPGHKSLDENDIQFLAPVPNPSKLICVGTNYHDHLREMHVTDLPQFPYAFLRPNLCLAGHRDDVFLPDWPQFVDWEAELGIIVGKTGNGFKGTAARAAIAGYTIINDLSARDWIESRPWVGIDWVMQKAWDHFQPTGPWFTPAEFVPDPHALDIELTVNGAVRQKSNTSEMIFGVDAIIEHLSAIMTLEAGDIIATGTPAGVGFGLVPRVSLQRGDTVIVTIEGLGQLETTMH